MKITMNGELVKVAKNQHVLSRMSITDSIKVQYKNQKLLINGQAIEEFDSNFINKLDQSIKQYQLKIQQSIQMFICNRQEILKINFTNKKVVTRYIWISENYQEIKYSEYPLSKCTTKITFNDITFEYIQKDQSLLKAIEKYDLGSEYYISLKYKKKCLDLSFQSFSKLNKFVLLCNWILKSKGLDQIKFSALLFLKQKLQNSANKEGVTLRKYFKKQLNRIQTQYTLKLLQIKHAQQQQQQMQCAVQFTIKKSSAIEKNLSDEKENQSQVAHHNRKNSSLVKKINFND